MFKPTIQEQAPDYIEVEEIFGVSVPLELQNLLNDFGYGYSERQEILLFGGDDTSRSLVQWNKDLVKIGIFPPPSEGGPIFLAENCLGTQYGFRKEDGNIIYILFDPNTFESFVIAKDKLDYLTIISTDEETITLSGAIYPILESKGPLKTGYHFAPFVSPMLGGSLKPSNWSLAPAKAHMATALAEFRATNGA